MILRDQETRKEQSKGTATFGERGWPCPNEGGCFYEGIFVSQTLFLCKKNLRRPFPHAAPSSRRKPLEQAPFAC